MSNDFLTHNVESYLDWEQDSYKAFSCLLKEVLDLGSKTFTYNSTVSVRTKAPASFAEKCIRKSAKYSDPVHELTDLCGARVVTNTLDEVELLCAFVEKYFVVDHANSEDKLSILGISEFSYRSVHFVVQVDFVRLQCLPLDAKWMANLVEKINRPQKGDSSPFLRKAEIQLRTGLQHIWADTLHDRSYKTGIRLPQALLRESHRIAALLEKADEDLLRLTHQIDAFSKDYAAHLSPQTLEKELGIVRSLIEQPLLDAKERGAQVLRYLHLLAAARHWPEIIRAKSFRAISAEPDFLNAFDHQIAVALCRIHSKNPESAEFKEGLQTLSRLSAGQRKLADLAMAYFHDTIHPESEKLAGEFMFQAHLSDADNPYLFCDSIWFQLGKDPDRHFLRFNWVSIENAMKVCREHYAVGLDHNRVWATLGRFHLLRGEWGEAGQAYARLMSSATSPEVIEDECEILEVSAKHLSNKALVSPITYLARALRLSAKKRELPQGKNEMPVLVIAGTCSPEKAQEIEPFRNKVVKGLRCFEGLVIGGATRDGVAGFAGDALLQSDSQFHLIGFLPCSKNFKEQLHPAYTEVIEGEDADYGMESVIQYWEYLFDKGILPEQVRVLGIGGGTISRFEYDLAIALGATVGLVKGSGREADKMLRESPWWPRTSLVELFDDNTLFLFCMHRPHMNVSVKDWEYGLAEHMHNMYLQRAVSVPENCKPWSELKPTYQKANLDQVQGMVHLLCHFGLQILPLSEVSQTRKNITNLEAFLGKDQLWQLAQWEHARWYLERVTDGWQFNKERDNAKKLHPDLIPWKQLSLDSQEKDRNAVQSWPSLLEECNLGIFAIDDQGPEAK